ncbi:MAG: hypothetical protein AB1589_02215 [Cyanobacteriota bacterium]
MLNCSDAACVKPHGSKQQTEAAISVKVSKALGRGSQMLGYFPCRAMRVAQTVEVPKTWRFEKKFPAIYLWGKS